MIAFGMYGKVFRSDFVHVYDGKLRQAVWIVLEQRNWIDCCSVYVLTLTGTSTVVH